jgi:hypothetical protein
MPIPDVNVIEAFYQATWDLSWTLFEISLKAEESLEELRISPLKDHDPQKAINTYKVISDHFTIAPDNPDPADNRIALAQIADSLNSEIIPQMSILMGAWNEVTSDTVVDNGEKALMGEEVGDGLRLIRTTCLALCEELEMTILASVTAIRPAPQRSL